MFSALISLAPLGKMDITGMGHFAQVKNDEVDTTIENPINIVGDIGQRHASILENEGCRRRCEITCTLH